MYDIKDKIVLVTGAAVGIGASVVRALLEEEIKHVTILDIDDKNGLAIQEELNAKHGTNKVKFVKCDVTQDNELVNAFKAVKDEQGYIDIVINNAGIFDDKNFAKEIEVNLIAVVRGTLLAWDLMSKDKGGKGGTVINVASIAALSSHFVVPIYSATKSGVVKFSNTLGHEVHYSRTGVRILAICYSVTNTTMAIKGSESFDPVIGEAIQEVLKSSPWQTSEHAAQGLIEVFKKGESGSIWTVVKDKPAIDFTEKYVQIIKMFDDIIGD